MALLVDIPAPQVHLSHNLPISFSRSATFPRSGVATAQDRIFQLSGHLTPSNTLASQQSDTNNNNNNNNNNNTPTQSPSKQNLSEGKTNDMASKPQETTKKSTLVDIDGDIEDIHNQLPPLPNPLPKPHPDFVHCIPPEAPVYRKYSIFTAGSIEMGAAVQWQRHMATFLSDLPITVNNPRRGHWDPSATQEAKNEAFRHQVEWELSALEKADVICFFFDLATKSPVTMLELGLWAHSGKVVVCCDKRFWRAGNIHIVCQRYNIPFVETFEDLVPAVKKMLVEKGMKLDKQGNLIE